MPSRAEMRVRAEQLLRGVVIATLAVMLWQSLHDQDNAGARTVGARGIGKSTLADWSALAKAPTTVHVQLASVPSIVERAWLGALAGAGSRVTWSGDLEPAMIAAEPVASPNGGAKVLVAAPKGASVVVSDDVGPVDTVRAQGAGAMLSLDANADRFTARARGSVASTTNSDSAVLRRILVIANAGWESKFVAAALEEEGWKVDAFIRVAPGVDVAQGRGVVIDTSNYSAVVALDGAASQYANRIAQFALTGGGVVLGRQAAAIGAMDPLRSGYPGGAVSERAGDPNVGATNLTTLALTPITSLASDAIPLEKRGGAVAVAARRFGAGRVVQLGYDDTWHWRMSGAEDAVRDHRLWWTRVVSSVAYAPRVSRVLPSVTTDEAPMIGLVSAIGSAGRAEAIPGLTGNRADPMAWLFLLLLLALIGEIASRRMRGVS